MRRGTFQWMKSVNKSIILNKIRINEPISRAEIAKQTELTPPTVSSIVKELIEQGLVCESEPGASKGGRKPTMLLINNDAFYVIGVDAGPATVESVLTDLAGSVIKRTEILLDNIETLTNDRFLATLKESIKAVIGAVSDYEKIIGIGIAMHGVVDVDTGTSLFAPNLHLSNIPIKEELEKDFGIVVKVENDARAMALGESWFGNHRKVNSMMAVNLGSGVGAGVVINGKLYHGAQDIAGEIGHMTIDINGTVCECGNRGCLQTFASGPAIAERAARTLVEQSSDDAVDPSEVTGEKVYQLAKAGNDTLAKVLQETGTFLGAGLTNIIHVINPELIVIGGGVSRAHEFILPSIQQSIEERALTPEAKKTNVKISELGDDATLLGAVSLLLVELFEQV